VLKTRRGVENDGEIVNRGIKAGGDRERYYFYAVLTCNFLGRRYLSRIVKDDKVLRRPYLTLPGVSGMPDVREILAQMPEEQKHRFESSGEFIRRLAYRIGKWRESLPDDEEPAIFAIMANGDAVEVYTLGEDGHSGVVVEGNLSGAPCMLITHQSSFQIVCYTRKIEEEKPRRMIGFHVGGEAIEA